MFDIDHFKRVNDTYGHQAGDEVIRVVSNLLIENKRDMDIAGRYGGEEFCVILLDTDNQGGLGFAERLRKAVEANPINYEGQQIQCKISLGVARSQHGRANTWSGWNRRTRRSTSRKRTGGTVPPSIPNNAQSGCRYCRLGLAQE